MEYLLLFEEYDPKKGTGKKPKGSGRRLYTDENPKDTVSVKFRTKEDIQSTINSKSFKSKSHKRQSQILNLIEQRLRVSLKKSKDPETKKRLQRGYDYIKSKCEASKLKTKRLNESNEDKLIKVYTFSDIYKTTNFVKQACDIFTTLDHHPDYFNWSDNIVTMHLTTHSVGGVSHKDLEVVDRLNDLNNSFSI